MKKLFIASLVLGVLAFLALPGLAQLSPTYAPAMSPYLKKVPQELERLDPKALALLDPKALGQLDPQALAKVAKELNQIDPKELGQLDPQAMSKLDPQALAQLNKEALAKLDPKARALLDPKALTQLSPQALSKVTQALKQVEPQALDPVPGQLDPQALVQLDPQALWQLDPKALALLDPKALAQLDPQALSKVAQALKQVNPQALGQLDPQALAKLDPQALAQFDPQALGQLDPKALALLDPKALATLDAQVLGQIGEELSKIDPQALIPVTKDQPTTPVVTQDNGTGPQEPDTCDVSFDVDVVKQKKISINKQVNKQFNFVVNITSQSTSSSTPWAEVEVFKCDVLADNNVTVAGLIATDSIESSFNGFTGVGIVNQMAGVLTNQGSVMAASLTGSPFETSTSFSLVEVAVEKTNADNRLTVADSVFADAINSSFNDFEGLGMVNQAAGILINQDSVLALGTNLEAVGLVAENDTFLSLQNVSNKVDVVPQSLNASANLTTEVITSASMTGSFNDFTGVAMVNQASGFLSNQAIIFSVAHAGR